MTKQDYMQRILSFCNTAQQGMFTRMYPAGPSTTQQKNATSQIERTLVGNGNSTLSLKKGIEELNERLIKSAEVTLLLQKQVKDLQVDLTAAEKTVLRLSNPDTLETAETQERLEFLYALEAAGVDNWEGYGLAQEIMAEVHG